VVEKRHVGDEIQLLPCLVVRFEPGLEGTMVKKKIVGEGGKRKELTNHGLAQLSPRSPGRSRAIPYAAGELRMAGCLIFDLTEVI
jgi:hypothetical protein